MKFRKKPVVIEAWHNVDDCEPRPEWACEPHITQLTGGRLAVPTLEGVMVCNLGDWLIRGIKGELYPCKPEIFEATYERVEP